MHDKTPLAAPLCIVRVLLCISSAIQTTAGYDRDHSKQLPWQVTRILRGSLFALVVLSYYVYKPLRNIHNCTIMSLCTV